MKGNLLNNAIGSSLCAMDYSLGGVIGATVVVSILLAIVQPFKRLEGLGPVLDRLDTTLKQSSRR